MNIVADPDAMAEGEPRESRSDGALWHHAAFCQLALPMQAADAALWLRETETASVAIAATGDADGTTQPAGKFLRLLLIHLFTRAVQDKSASVELGESAAALASAMQLDPDAATIQELTEQCARLAAARITVTLDSAAPLSVFDARGRPRANAAEWRPSLRLNSRFLEQLTQHAVRLDRSVMAALAGNLPALDAYAWVAGAMPAPGEAGTQASWGELCLRFGEPGMTPDEHRARFETCLQLVSAAWPQVRLIMGEEGVGVRRSEREAPRPRTEAIDPPAPIVTAPPPVQAAPPPAPVATREPQPPAPRPEPTPQPQAAQREPTYEQPDSRNQRDDRIALKSHLTGLQQVVWLLRGDGGDDVMLEVTPGARYDPQNATILALEPIIVQVSGGLYARDFERMAAWINSNRDLIDEVWYDELDDDTNILDRVRKVPPPGWR